MHSKIIVARIPPVITTVPAVIRKALHQHPKKQREKAIRLTRKVYIKLFMIKGNPLYDHCVNSISFNQMCRRNFMDISAWEMFPWTYDSNATIITAQG